VYTFNAILKWYGNISTNLKTLYNIH
jgi:hypothetical protein